MDAWRAIVEIVRAKRPALASVLEHAAVLAIGAGEVVVAYEQGSFLAAQAMDKGALELLTSAAREHFQNGTMARIDVGGAIAATVSLSQIDAADRKARVDAARRAVKEHPAVSAAIELLGAELRDVRLASDVESG